MVSMKAKLERFDGEVSTIWQKKDEGCAGSTQMCEGINRIEGSKGKVSNKETVAKVWSGVN